MDMLVTGNPNSGKTVFCERIIGEAKKLNLKCGGVICPTMRKYDTEISIATDIITQESRVISTTDDVAGIKIGSHTIIVDGLSLAKRAIRRALDCDLIIIDEFGPLELRGEGLIDEITKALNSGRNTIIIVRTKLKDRIIEQFPEVDFRVLSTDDFDKALKILNHEIKGKKLR